MIYTVITENDESQWNDVTGVSYHFPSRYKKYLEPGTDVVYYKGKLKNLEFRSKRLTDDPHYFGIARIGRVNPDFNTERNYFFAEIVDYKPFQRAVKAKQKTSYIEQIPPNLKNNYWRDGVRQIDKAVFQRILALTSLDANFIEENTTDVLFGIDQISIFGIEGESQLRHIKEYKRDLELREAAIEIHGTTCMGCGFNFAEIYGSHGAGYIQVHHLNPLSEPQGERTTHPRTDLVVLCANCHVMVHRIKNKTLSMKELKRMVEQNAK